MSAITTRDALAKALEQSVSDLNNRGVISDGYGWVEIADALLASDVVIDAASLADDEALVERFANRVYGEPADAFDIENAAGDLRALAAALSTRGGAA